MCECVVWCLMCGCVVQHGWTPTFCSRQSGRRRHGGNLLTEMWSEAISPSLLFLKGLHNGKDYDWNFAIDTTFSVNLIKRTIEARCSKLSCCYGFYDCDNINFWTYGIIIRLLTFESPTFVFQLIIGRSCKSEEIMALANCVSSNWLKGG